MENLNSGDINDFNNCLRLGFRRENEALDNCSCFQIQIQFICPLTAQHEREDVVIQTYLLNNASHHSETHIPNLLML